MVGVSGSVSPRSLGAAVALVFLTAALFVACTPAPLLTNPLGVLMADRTTATGSFQVTEDESTVDSSNPSHVDGDTSQAGIIDLVHDRSQLTATAVSASFSPAEQVTVGTESWVRSPHPVNATDPEPWLLEPGGFLGFYEDIVDPAGLIGDLRQRGVQLHFAGSEQVRGVHTFHYRVTTVPLIGTVTSFVFGPVQFDVWIDANDLIRQLRETAEIGPQASGQEQSVVDTFDLFDFGVKDNIQPPPPDQVQDLGSTNSQAPPTTVPVLPRATLTASSTLQLRTVEMVRTPPCAANSPAANPAPGQPASLRGVDGNCYDLDSAAVTVMNAQASPEAEYDNQLGVRVTLDSSEVAGLVHLAVTENQIPVAIVMFGEVLSAPTFASQQLMGEVIITPITPQTAANVIAALAS